MAEKTRNALVVGKQKLALQKLDINQTQLDLIRTTIAPDLDDNQLMFFLSAADRRGLDPLQRQIYGILRQTKRGPVMTIQVGIDGFRLIAARTGESAGADEPVFEDDQQGNPIKCTYTVYRIVKGMRVGFPAIAYFKEYCPVGYEDFMWRKMPHSQLEKCAEAKALRKAFPGDLGDLYINEEMDQAGGEDVPTDGKGNKAALMTGILSAPQKEAPKSAPKKPEPKEVKAEVVTPKQASKPTAYSGDPWKHLCDFGTTYKGKTLDSVPEQTLRAALLFYDKPKDLPPENYQTYLALKKCIGYLDENVKQAVDEFDAFAKQMDTGQPT